MNESSQPNNSSSATSYSALNLYSKAWAMVKKNIKPLALITLIGAVVSVAVTTIMTIALIDTIRDGVSDTDGIAGAILAGMLTLGVAIIASVYVTLLQVVALKKATEGKAIEAREIVNESAKFVPRALAYGAFIMSMLVASAFAVGFIGAVVGPLSILLGLAFIVAFVLALFRYAFIQFVIVEPKEMAFLDRFSVSKKLTDGIYGTLFVVWLIGFLISIGASFAGGILSAPFDGNSTNTNTPGLSSLEDGETELSVFIDAVEGESVSVNGVITSLISTSIGSFVSLLFIGTLLELYRQRKNELKF